MRFHVLGVGSIGTLISHHLRLAHPRLPISLITKHASGFPSTRLYPYGKPGEKPITLSVEREGTITQSTDYQLEVWHDGLGARQLQERLIALNDAGKADEEEDPPNGKINSLIVCLKTSATLPALSVLRPRLSPSSVITLVQNGMGVFDELCESLWPDPATRPFFIMGTTTHGATKGDGFGSIKHRTRSGEGDIKWGVAPDPRGEIDFEDWLWGEKVGGLPILAPPPSPLLPLPEPPIATSTDLKSLHETLEALLSLSYLSPSLLPMPHLHHQLLVKLAINSVINPLTAVIGAGALNNGSLFGSAPSHRIIRQLVHETSDVLTAYIHSLASPHSPPPDVLRLFSPESLESRALAVIRSTAENTSSMAADVSHGRRTEINHITGYLISLGKRLGIPTPSHVMIADMVRFTAQVNGLRTGLGTTYEKVAQRRKDIQDNVKYSIGARITPQSAALEEKRLELKERELWIAEEQIFQETRRKRAKKGSRDAARWLERIKEISGEENSPTQKDWALMDRREKQKRLKIAIESAEGTPEIVNPSTLPTIPSNSTPKSVSDSVSTSPSPSPLSPSQAKGTWMDALISSAPRQERTWDNFLVPPTARGPVPKKRVNVKKEENAVTSSPTDQKGDKSTATPTSETGGSMADMMARMIGNAPRAEVNWDDPSGSTSPTASTHSNPAPSKPAFPSDPFPISPTSPISPLDTLISSAPRAERSWEVRGGNITGYTGSSPSPRSIPARKTDLSRGGLGSALDSLIGSAPRLERTWEAGPDRTGKRADGGRFTTSRTSGS